MTAIPKTRAFMGRYGTEKHIVDILKDKGNATIDELRSTMRNPNFKGGHITMLLNHIDGEGSMVDPIRQEIAQHPQTSKQNLERLVDPHRGWPFRGTQQHRWPVYASLAARRINQMEEDDE
jgi:hypothetical protein